MLTKRTSRKPATPATPSFKSREGLVREQEPSRVTLLAFSDVDINARWRMTKIHGHKLWVVQSKGDGKYIRDAAGGFIAVGGIDAAKALIKQQRKLG